MDITVISSELDGAELKREQDKRPNYVRCDGRDDEEQIQGAIDRAAVGGKVWGGLGEAWTRIFGKR